MNIARLIEIAKEIGMDKAVNNLTLINQRNNDNNCNLVLPLVGEFSSGKTTLINALTDSKQLETATLPTTSTIFEIHFGCDSCRATIIDENGNSVVTEDISTLKNENLKDVQVVVVEDTSKIIPPNIVLADTPGLSSGQEKHKRALIEFLPDADGILAVVDINQQITRSLTDFIKDVELSNRPVFLIVRKCDTKSPEEIALVKDYIFKNHNIPPERMAFVSAISGDFEELVNILIEIHKEKFEILKKVNESRVKIIAKDILCRIDELLKATLSEKELEKQMADCQRDLNNVKRTIDKIVDSSKDDIEDIKRDINRKFEDDISSRLMSIVTSKQADYNIAVISEVSNVETLYLQQFKMELMNSLSDKARSIGADNTEIQFPELNQLDLSGLGVGDSKLSIDLNVLGHNNDKTWANVLKGAAAIAAVVVAPEVIGAAGLSAGATTVGPSAATAAATYGLVDTAVDVGQTIYFSNKLRKMERAGEVLRRSMDNLDAINSVDNRAGSQLGQKKGVVEGFVSKVTDPLAGKPQRQRAINEFLSTTVLPSFNCAMANNVRLCVDAIRHFLLQDAETTIQEKQTALETLKNEYIKKKDEFAERMAIYRGFKNEIKLV